jgi:hypothetical protein
MVEAWERKAQAADTLFSLSEAETALLTYLDENGETTIDRYMTGAHISRASAVDIVARLYAMDIVDFRYTGTEFVIVRR